VIGHRGAAAHAPENTIPSFRLALEQGADALELDVHASSDGVPVVIHDPGTFRTTGEALVVARETAARLHALGAGIPTLDEVLETFPTAALLIEVKVPAVQEAVLATVRAHRAAGRVAVGSEHHAALAAFRGTEVAVSGSRREIAALWARARLGLGAGRVGCAMFSVPEHWRGLRVPTRGFLRRAHAAGAAVHVWTVDDPLRAMALWTAGVQGIVTNDPATIVRARQDCAA
jgi:glycerophosphoryl diester phosphodiesterase